MKLMHRILSAVLVLMLFAACAKQTPVTQYTAIFDEIAESIDEAPSMEEAYKIITSQQSEWNSKVDQLIQANSDYLLTDDDKQMLKTSMKRYMEATTKKSLELQGQKPEGVEETVNSMLEAFIFPSIDAASTLGDLASTRPAQ